MTKSELLQFRILCEYLDALPIFLEHLAALVYAY